MHRFEEIKCIGRGSYGSAHLVRVRQQNGIPDRFVVKKIPMELLSIKEKNQSFREVELLAKLKHPNVVEYSESFEVDNVLHIVMAYCDGGDLADKIKRQQMLREQIIGPDSNFADPRGYFPISQVLDWFVQMAMAIKYLHGQRVLHRDLKTSNVFLTTDNVVKLGDFGIAKTLDSTLDQAQTVVGTPYYMSPEVCESKPYSYASDVWSLGCVLYEMLTLRHAFDAPNILTLILKIVQQDFTPIPPHYDSEVSSLLHKLLDKNPERRPSMEDIFAMPYIRHHMQGLVASGGSLKVKVVNPMARRPQHDCAAGVCRRRLHPKNFSARRLSGEQRKLRSLASFPPSQAAPIVPLQWMPITTFDDNIEDSDSDKLKVLDMSITEDSQIGFRPPERSSTPDPLVFATEEKSILDEIHEEIDEQCPFSSAALPKRKRIANDQHFVAWKGEENHENAKRNDCVFSDLNNATECAEDIRFHADAEELMNPNYENEYSEECLDSLRIYYGSKGRKNNIQSPNNLRRRGANGRGNAIDGNWSDPTVIQVADLRNSEEVLELSNLSIEDAELEDNGTPSLSESLMMRELELDADSNDEDASSNSSLTEYEAEENYYSDDSSDFFDQSGTQYSDDFEDPDAEVIEYADDEFLSEEDNEHNQFKTIDFQNTLAPYRRVGDNDSRVTRMPKLEIPREVQWVMRNVAQSLMSTTDEMHSGRASSA
ncbi:putative serine/threonine-protein kinase YKL116C, predicted [Plasmopara halstedii]